MIAVAMVNVSERKVRRSSKARSVRWSTSWRATKATSASTPTVNQVPTATGETFPPDWPSTLRA